METLSQDLDTQEVAAIRTQTSNFWHIIYGEKEKSLFNWTLEWGSLWIAIARGGVAAGGCIFFDPPSENNICAVFRRRNGKWKFENYCSGRRSQPNSGGTVPVTVAASLKCFWHFRREVADADVDVDASAVMIIIIIGSTPPRFPPASGQQCMDGFRSNFPIRQTTNFFASFDTFQRGGGWGHTFWPDCRCCIWNLWLFDYWQQIVERLHYLAWKTFEF